MLQPRLISVEPIDPLKLRLTYETGEVKLFNAVPYARGDWHGQLLDRAYFQTVRVLPGGIGIEWGNGQDIAPMSFTKEACHGKQNAPHDRPPPHLTLKSKPPLCQPRQRGVLLTKRSHFGMIVHEEKAFLMCAKQFLRHTIL